MVLIRLTPPGAGVVHPVSPDTVLDILWAAALPGDRLEHIRARPGPRAPDLDLVLFHRSRPTTEPEPATTAHTSLQLCRRAIQSSPTLSGWNPAVLLTPPAQDTPDEPCSISTLKEGTDRP
jgi:hypothetical protein